jgi:hypothetical protein
VATSVARGDCYLDTPKGYSSAWLLAWSGTVFVMAAVTAAARAYPGGTNENVQLRALWPEALEQTATSIRLKVLSNGVEEDSDFRRDACSGGLRRIRSDRRRRSA